MSNNRIKVSGYSQKVSFGNGIEWRPFSPDLVGLQLTSEGGTPLFTMGNFSVTTNTEPKKTKIFTTKNFSNFVTLTDLDLTLESAQELLTNNAGVILNLDKKTLTNYALFGSLVEFVRVSLENIITKWPAALYVNPVFSLPPDYLTQTGYTVENYVYNNVTQQSTFKVNVNAIQNNFNINFIQTGSLTNTFNEDNSLRNLVSSYPSYSIRYNNVEYDVIGFTGTTSSTNDYLYFSVSGNVFSGLSSSDYPIYYIKPNADKENMFFNSLDTFEAYLLNRQSNPKYTATFSYNIKTDAGSVLYVTNSVTWPTTDGYNIDFDTDAYNDYASTLLDISTNFDSSTSNLMVRFLVSESITAFDTSDVHLSPLDQDQTDQKMNKTLAIYGRSFDDFNSYINGVQFANVVSYDKNNNTPDIYIKNLARVLGWDLISSVIENDLLTSYIQPNQSTFSGHSVGLTPVEADIELWRRLILNTPWIWKSKGTRKAIEFLFKFIGTPLGLISFNEYIYLAENKIDLDEFRSALQLNQLDDDVSLYPISLSGYPQPNLNTSTNYFQNNGLWYRETGGDNSTVDINSGNNPHIGPYDGGYAYINQFRELIPNFSSVTISSETVTTSSTNIFTNYNRGTMTSYNGGVFVDVTTDDGVDFSNCYVVTPSVILDPKHRQDQTNCGCLTDENLKSLSICLDKQNQIGDGTATPSPADCSNVANMSVDPVYRNLIFNYYQYNIDGSLYTNNGQPVLYSSPFINVECCNFPQTLPYFYNQTQLNPNTGERELVNSGYICCTVGNTCGCLSTCDWVLAPSRYYIYNGAYYLNFITSDGTNRLTSFDGCNCAPTYSHAVLMTDPITGEEGFACQLNQAGFTDIQKQDSALVKTYEGRADGTVGCRVEFIPEPEPVCDLVLTMSSTQSSNGVNNGTATVSVTGGYPPYTYTWDDGMAQHTPTATNLNPRPYAVFVGDSRGCSAMGSVVVTEVACHDLSGEIQFSTITPVLALAMPTSGTAPYTYLWNNGATTQYIQPVAEGSQVSVTITDARNCSTTLTGTAPVINGQPQQPQNPAVEYKNLNLYLKANNGQNLPPYHTGLVSIYYKYNVNGNYVKFGEFAPYTLNHMVLGAINNVPSGTVVYLAIVDDEGNDINFGTIREYAIGTNNFACCGYRLPELVSVQVGDPTEINLYIDLNTIVNNYVIC
jgi:hypothetical protein